MLLKIIKMGKNNMFHYDNREELVSFDAYFYIPVNTEKLYVTKKEKAFEHNYPENFRFCPETGKALWNTSRKNIDILSSDKIIIDPETNELLANVFERFDLNAIGYKIDIGKPFSIPYDNVEKLLVILKKYGVISEDVTFKDFKFIYIKDNFDLIRIIRKDWPGTQPEKRYGSGGSIASGIIEDVQKMG